MLPQKLQPLLQLAGDRVAPAEREAGDEGTDREEQDRHDGVLAPKEQLVPNGPTVTLEDLTDRLTKQFRRQDRDHSGWLSAKEFLAPPA